MRCGAAAQGVQSLGIVRIVAPECLLGEGEDAIDFGDDQRGVVRPQEEPRLDLQPMRRACGHSAAWRSAAPSVWHLPSMHAGALDGYSRGNRGVLEMGTHWVLEGYSAHLGRLKIARRA